MLQALLNMGQAALSLFSFLFLITHLFSSLTPFPLLTESLYIASLTPSLLPLTLCVSLPLCCSAPLLRLIDLCVKLQLLHVDPFHSQLVS